MENDIDLVGLLDEIHYFKNKEVSKSYEYENKIHFLRNVIILFVGENIMQFRE